MSLARIKMRALGLALVAALATQAATHAHASEPETPKEIFDRGMFHYNLGEFETALEYFTKGYELEPLPDLLFNIGQCHRNMKEYERAVFFFERYLAELKSPAERTRINKLLDELRPLVPRTKSSTVAAAPAPAPSADSAALVVSPSESEDDSIVEEWWFWALIVGAVGATAAAVAVSQSGGAEPVVTPPDGAIVFDFRGL